MPSNVSFLYETIGKLLVAKELLAERVSQLERGIASAKGYKDDTWSMSAAGDELDTGDDFSTVPVHPANPERRGRRAKGIVDEPKRADLEVL